MQTLSKGKSESVKYCIHCGKPLDEPERQTPPVFDPNKEEELNDDWSKQVEEEKTEVIKPSKKNSHVPVLIALGILVGLLVIGGVGYFMYSNHQHQQEIARLEQEKEQEKEARKKAEEEADDLQDENEYLEDRNDRLENRQKDENESEDMVLKSIPGTRQTTIWPCAMPATIMRHKPVICEKMNEFLLRKSFLVPMAATGEDLPPAIGSVCKIMTTIIFVRNRLL